MFVELDKQTGHYGMRTKLTDFDVAKDYGYGSRPQTRIGTMPFEAPEILFDGAQPTIAVDVWGIGEADVVLNHLRSSHLIFTCICQSFALRSPAWLFFGK